MPYIPIFGAFYITLIFTDLIPLMRKKEKKYLRFCIPVYLFTLIANIILGMDIRITSITAILEKFMSNFIK